MGLLKKLFTMLIGEFEGWLTAIMSSGKFNIILICLELGGYRQWQLI